MHILEYYYEHIIKQDLTNKFQYSNLKNIPKLKKIILNFGCQNHEIKNIVQSILSLELITNKQSKLSKTKNSNVFLKIKKGAPIGCYVILKKTKMYKFLFKLLVKIFPILKDFKGISFLLAKNNVNSFSFYIHDLINIKELNTHFYLFNNLPSLNIIIITNTKTKKEFLYLLKSFKIPLILKN